MSPLQPCCLSQPVAGLVGCVGPALSPRAGGPWCLAEGEAKQRVEAEVRPAPRIILVTSEQREGGDYVCILCGTRARAV